MAVSSKALLPGTFIFGGSRDYRVVRPLGSGGFGITYLVECQLEGGLFAYFALKEHFLERRCDRTAGTTAVVYSQPVAEEVENSMRDFIAEANRLRRLGEGHSNIVKVHDIFCANNTAYYVMEYLEGQTLRSYVQARGALTPVETRQLLTPVADALGFLHSNRLTHLDVKPDNIMLTADDDSVRPVLIDFGLSKHYGDDGRPTSSVNIAACTHGYSPIEQYGGLSEFQPTADIYSLGATMMFCLTGRDPGISTGMLPGELMAAMAHIPGDMPLLIEAMMAPQRNMRPQSMESVLDALAEPGMVSDSMSRYRGAVVPPPPPAPPVPPVPAALPARRSNTVRNIAIVAAVVGAIALAAGILFMVSTSSPSRGRIDVCDLFAEYTTTEVVDSHSRFITGDTTYTPVMGISLKWDSQIDLDIVAVEPGGNTIYYGSTQSHATGGQFDNDMLGGPGAEETITWSRPVPGTYYFFASTRRAIDDLEEVVFTLTADGTEDTSRILLKSLVSPSFSNPEYFLLGTYEFE